MIETDKNLFEERKQYKVTLTRLLFKQNFEKKTIGNLLIFIDNILALPPKMEEKYRQIFSNEIKKNKPMALTFENSNMAHSIRVLAHREGREEGREEGIEMGFVKGIDITKWRMAYTGIIKNYDNDVICDITGISEEKINLLRQKVSELGEKTIEWIENEAVGK